MLEMLPKLAGFEPSEAVQEGSYNYTIKGQYNGKKALLKIWNYKIPSFKERFQNELQVYLNPAVTTKPHLFYHDITKHFIVIEFIDGILLREFIAEENYLPTESVVKTIKKIHNLDQRDSNLNSYFNYLKGWIDPKFRHAAEKPENKQQTFQKIFFALKNHYTQLQEITTKHNKKIILSKVHGDFNDTNILLKNSKVYFVDWEYSHLGNKYLDISQITNNNDNFANAFLERYFEDCDFDKELHDFFINFFLLKISINYLLDRNNLAKKNNRKALIVNGKLRRILEMQNITYNLEDAVVS